MKKVLIIIDSHALIHRAFHAFPPTLTTKDGEPVNAVYGYFSLLLDVIAKFNPTNIIAVFDSKGPTVRQNDYTQYKANRSETDDLLKVQFERIHDLVKGFNIPKFNIEGIEADDLIATIDHKFAGDWAETIVVTGDKDLLQLVDQDTFVYLAGHRFSESKLYNEEMVKEKMGVTPAQIPDFKGISGDPSDNIPGVRGIGPKGACDLITKFGSVEEIYFNIDTVDNKYKNKLMENQELAFLSKKLATVDRNVPLSIDLKDSESKNLDFRTLRDKFIDLEFKSIIKKLDDVAKTYVKETQQIDMFTFDAEEANLAKFQSLSEAKSLYIYPEYHIGSKSPNEIKLGKVYLVTDKDQVSYADYDSLPLLKLEIQKSNLEKVITFDKKSLIHAFLNFPESQFVEEKKICDVGIQAFVYFNGRRKYDIADLLREANVQFSPIPQSIVQGIKKLDEFLKTMSVDKRKDNLVDLEDEILSTVVEMEQSGVKVDTDLLADYLNRVNEKILLLKQEIFKNAGHEFNINSPKQVGDVIYSEKNLPAFRKTKTGSFSTNEQSLRALKGIDPIINNILSYRELEKLKTTYIESLPTYVKSDGRIHAVFDQFGAVSGRFSSRNPNLQNIPAEEVEGINIRSSFISAEDSLLIAFDYSQQELRVLAAMSQEEEMIKAFNSGTDIHKITAAELFNKNYDEVTKEERSIGKTVNFSVIYGISAFALSERMEIERSKADEFIKKYFNKYKKVDEFMRSSMQTFESAHFSETILGRVRENKGIQFANKIQKSAINRELFNFIIQGSAADIMKVAMQKVEPILKKYPVSITMQIHDEFLFEYRTENPQEPNLLKFIQEVKDAMNTSLNIGVNYKVDASFGRSWGNMSDYD